MLFVDEDDDRRWESTGREDEKEEGGRATDCRSRGEAGSMGGESLVG
jgi:hypothetical protein